MDADGRNIGLRGFHHEDYNYGVKNAQKTRYGCVKKGCPAKLYINENHDTNSITLLKEHTCLKSTHQSLGKRILRQKCKENAAAPLAGSSRRIFDVTCFQNPTIASEGSFPSMQKSIQRWKGSARNNPGFTKQYSSIKALGKHLQAHPSLLTYNNNGKEMSISAYLLKSSSKSFHLSFYDEDLIAEFNMENDVFVVPLLR